jgi:carbon-monoxide dehydrogenase medium subunit
MIPSPFEYYSPTSLKEAITLLSSHVNDAKILAGGQSLLPLLKLRLARPGVVVDLGRITELNYIRSEGHEIAIGAMTTYSQLQASELLRNRCPLLPQTASLVGDVQIQNQGTLGGSLAHADPAGDMPATALALGAELTVVGPNGERRIRIEDFILTMLTTTLSPDEILTEIRVPSSEGSKTIYLKAAQRASGFAVVGVAACLKVGQDRICEEIAIGVTGVGDKAYRAEEVENKLKGKKLENRLIEEAAAETTHGVDVNEDINGSAEYRSHLARVYVARAIHASAESRPTDSSAT